MITKNKINVKKESELFSCTNEETKVFQYNMITREAFINSLSKSKFIEVRKLDLAHDIWIKLENLYEDDDFAKKVKLNWRTKLENVIIQEDESIRAYVKPITKIATGIIGGTIREDKVI